MISPATSASARATPEQDPACPELLRVLESVERDCPIMAPATPAFESCAASIERVGKSSKPGYAKDSAEVVSESLRVMLDPDFVRAGKSVASIAPDEPVVELARQRRAFAHGALRAHCGIGRFREQNEAWNKQAEAVFLSLQPAQSLCAKAGNDRRPLAAEETQQLHIDVRMFIEPDGTPTLASVRQRLPTMRADIALCVVRTFEKTRFAPPEGRALVGTNVTFSLSLKK